MASNTGPVYLVGRAEAPATGLAEPAGAVVRETQIGDMVETRSDFGNKPALASSHSAEVGAGFADVDAEVGRRLAVAAVAAVAEYFERERVESVGTRAETSSMMKPQMGQARVAFCVDCLG